MVDSSLRTTDTPLDDCDSKECKLPRRHEGLCDNISPIIIVYTNWKGEKKRRRLSPTGRMMFQGNDWHKVPCWLFEAIDCDDGTQKHFAMAGVDAAYRQMLKISIEARWTFG